APSRSDASGGVGPASGNPESAGGPESIVVVLASFSGDPVVSVKPPHEIAAAAAKHVAATMPGAIAFMRAIWPGKTSSVYGRVEKKLLWTPRLRRAHRRTLRGPHCAARARHLPNRPEPGPSLL